MTLTVKSFALVLAVAILPLSATAQDSTTQTEAPAAGGEVAPGGLAIGTPESQIDKGNTYVKEEFGDWQFRCIQTENAEDPCQLYQLLLDASDNPVAEISIFTVSGNEKIVGGATIVTPLETLLTTNLRLAVDGGEASIYPFSFCRRNGCFSRLGLTPADIARFRAGVGALVTIVPAAAPDQRVDLKASLSGFTAGWNALVKQNKAAAASE